MFSSEPGTEQKVNNKVAVLKKRAGDYRHSCRVIQHLRSLGAAEELTTWSVIINYTSETI